MNIVILSGRLGKDPDVRYTPNGKANTSFSLATTERWKNEDGKQEKTEWHNIVVWGKQAETCGEYLHKGDFIIVNGKIQTRSWEKDGVKQYKTEINMTSFEFGPKASKESTSPPTDEDDLPF